MHDSIKALVRIKRICATLATNLGRDVRIASNDIAVTAYVFTRKKPSGENTHATCTMTLEIDDDAVIDELWKVYVQSFAGQETQCLQDQVCFSIEAFTAAMRDPEWHKFPLITTEGRYVGLGVSTTNLDKARVAYTNPEAWNTRYPEFKDNIHYVPIISILEEFRKKRFFFPLIAEIYEHIGLRPRGIAAYDFSEEKNPGLVQMIVAVGLEMQRLGRIPADAEVMSRREGAQVYASTWVRHKP